MLRTSGLVTSALLAAVAAIGCKSRQAPGAGTAAGTAGAGSGSAPPTAPGALGTLSVTRDGARVAMARAMVKRLPVDGRYQVYVTSGDASCQELLANVFAHRDPSASLLFDAGDRLAADGSLAGTVTAVYSGPDDVTIEPGAKFALSGTAEAGARVEISIDAKLVVASSEPGRGGTVVVAGRFPATACGDQAADPLGIPKAPHPSTATLTVAGVTRPIVSAIRTGSVNPNAGTRPARNLVLSTGPKDCSDTTPWAAAILAYQTGTYELSGQWLGRTLRNSSMADKDGQPETKGLVVTAGTAGQSADGPTIELALAGQGTIDGYPVALAGSIEAIDCP